MKKSKNMSKKRGFTLTEIIVVIALTTLVLAMIGGCLYFISTYSGVLITKSEQLTRAQTIEKSMRGYAEDDISQLAYVELDDQGNLLFKGKTILKDTGLANFTIYSVGNYEDDPYKFFVKCKFQFGDDEPFDFIVGIATFIVQNENSADHYNIPYGTTSVDANAYRDSDYTSIIIPDTVKSIGDYAFANNNLFVNIPISVESIGNYAFSGCNRLRFITIPNSVKSIGERAFENCTYLTSVTIPSSADVADNAFYGCISIVEDISHLKSVGDYIFYENGDAVYLIKQLRNVKEIILPASYNNKKYSIDQYAFYDTNKLEIVYFMGTADDWSVIGGKDNLKGATVYYFSANEPTQSGFYWHLVDGVPKIWE